MHVYMYLMHISPVIAKSFSVLLLKEECPDSGYYL